MWEKSASNDKVVHVAEVNQPLTILIPGATSVLSHGTVAVTVATADLGIQVSRDLSEFASLVHDTNIPERSPGLSFGAKDFHLPVSGFLSAFTFAIHTSL